MPDPDQPRRKVKLSIAELADLIDSSTDLADYYLDLETGETYLVTQDSLDNLKDAYEQIGAENFSLDDLKQALEELHTPDWQIEEALLTYQIKVSKNERYLVLPRQDSHSGFSDMEDFIATVQSEGLRHRLDQAIHTRGPFRNFKDALARYPKERERWFAFKQARSVERVLDWLEQAGIEPEE